MTHLLSLSVALWLGITEVLTQEYRAVTLEQGERRLFKVPDLETVTGSSGRCVEEGVDSEDGLKLWVEASCAGVRTSLVWRKDGTRVHVLACAEDPAERTPEQLALRQRLQGELKALTSITACVHGNRVELWGWARTEAEAAKVAALEKRHGPDLVRNKVETLAARGEGR